MTFLDQISYSWSEQVQKMRNVTTPLFIYGAGSVAKDVFDELVNENINVDAFFVDDGYYVAGQNINGIDIKKYSDIVVDKYSIVMGVADYSEGEKLLRQDNRITDIFYILTPCYNVNPNEMAQFVQSNIKRYESALCKLDDLESQKCLVAFANTFLSGDMSYIFRCYNGRQNYFENDIYSISEISTFLDIGAFDGDTLKQFVAYTDGKFKKAWCIELDDMAYDNLCQYVKSERLQDKVSCYKECLWYEDGFEVPISTEDYSSQESMVGDAASGDVVMITKKVDTLLANRECPVNLLKINYMGGENSLKGARKLIIEDNPIIAIVVGFDGECLFTILDLFAELNIGYKIKLRFDRAYPQFLVLYAIPPGIENR